MGSAMSENKIFCLPAGTLLRDRFRIDGVLGEGGFGITYSGCDTLLEMRVAIKEYYPFGFANRNTNVDFSVIFANINSSVDFSKMKSKFLGEARTLAKFSNVPGIVGVRECFEENNTTYIVMDYIDGITLRNYVEKNGPFDARRFAALLLPMLGSLNKIHKKGIIHRDISPENIMLSREGTLMLCDFGAARTYSEPSDRTLTQFLKHSYAPPEQIRNSKNQRPWTDIYSLCATAYFCVTGIVPADASERVFSIDENFSDKLKKPSELGINIPRELEDIIMKGMNIRAENRFSSAAELAEAISCNGSELNVISFSTDFDFSGSDTACVTDSPSGHTYPMPEQNEERREITKYVPGPQNNYTLRRTAVMSRQKEERPVLTEYVQNPQSSGFSHSPPQEVTNRKDKSAQNEPAEHTEKSPEAAALKISSVRICADKLAQESKSDPYYACVSLKEIISSVTPETKLLKLSSCEFEDSCFSKLLHGISSVDSNIRRIEIVSCSSKGGLDYDKVDFSRFEKLEELRIYYGNYNNGFFSGSRTIKNLNLLDVEYDDGFPRFQIPSPLLMPSLRFISVKGDFDLVSIDNLASGNYRNISLFHKPLHALPVTDKAWAADITDRIGKAAAANPHLNELTVNGIPLDSESEVLKDALSSLPLTYLDLSDTNLQSSRLLSECSGLKKLYLNRCQLEELDGLKQMTSLKVLYAQMNRIKNIDGLISCTSLEHLSLPFNHITNTDGLINCTSLEHLSLHFNLITNADGLINCASLCFADLSYNRLTDASALDSSALVLSYVDLSRNEDLEIQRMGDISKWRSLRFLKISKTGGAPAKLVLSSENLLELKAHGCMLTDISANINSGFFRNLKYADISNNKLSNDSVLSLMRNAETLLVHDNEFTEISAVLNASVCTLSGNPLKRLPVISSETRKLIVFSYRKHFTAEELEGLGFENTYVEGSIPEHKLEMYYNSIPCLQCISSSDEIFSLINRLIPVQDEPISDE